MSSAPDILDDEKRPRERFGWTLDVEAGGDINIGPDGEPTEVEGAEAVKQDLKIALGTPNGADPFRNEYGFNQFTAIGGSTGTGDARLRAEIVQTIGPREGDPGSGRGDPRVARVNHVNITRPSGDREAAVVDIELTLVDGTVTQFEFPIQRSRDYQYKEYEEI